MEEFLQNVKIRAKTDIEISGVTDAGDLTEQKMTVFTEGGQITVRGNGLITEKLDTEKGEFAAHGKILSVSFSERLPKRTSLRERLLK